MYTVDRPFRYLPIPCSSSNDLIEWRTVRFIYIRIGTRFSKFRTIVRNLLRTLSSWIGTPSLFIVLELSMVGKQKVYARKGRWVTWDISCNVENPLIHFNDRKSRLACESPCPFEGLSFVITLESLRTRRTDRNVILDLFKISHDECRLYLNSPFSRPLFALPCLVGTSVRNVVYKNNYFFLLIERILSFGPIQQYFSKNSEVWKK